MGVHTIDLQYHAGQERQSGQDLEAYVEHARVTGRAVLGMTDHIEIYVGEADKPGPYDQSLDGLQAYHDDVRAMADRNPDLQLLFAPELGSRFDFDSLPAPVLDLADLFICEVPVPSMDPAENTATMCDRMEAIAGFRDAVDVPVFFAHPFRTAINNRLVKRDIEPWVAALEPQPLDAWDDATIDRFMTFDVAAIGETAAGLDLPVEINGNTHYRTRASNLPAALGVLQAACLTLRDAGVSFVPGSDQHGFMRGIGRCGGYVPWETFQMIDVGLGDLDHLVDLGVDPDRLS